MPTVFPLPDADRTLIADMAELWRCSLVEAEERLVKAALAKLADPGIESTKNVYQLPTETQQ